ncbi:unnamed protein product [Lactuca virosa]|uniref:Uncharacterized protein n=1 Tax=Lactuca virosa TaxID=75947 RepID=A0AAU9N5L8_9ASTR|nr:unnamed protein product [Lactuca virosa]
MLGLYPLNDNMVLRVGLLNSSMSEQTRMMSVDRMAGANIPSLAAMEHTQMLAHTLAQNTNPKFQVRLASGDWENEYQQQYNAGPSSTSWEDQYAREEASKTCLLLILSTGQPSRVGRTPEFLVYGQGQQRKAVIEVVRLSESGNKIQISDSDDKFVAQAKASGKSYEDCKKSGNAIGAAILTKYEEILQSCNALDYHDLIIYSMKLLIDFPEG